MREEELIEEVRRKGQAKESWEREEKEGMEGVSERGLKKKHMQHKEAHSRKCRKINNTISYL